jgi:hypothetical protein
MLSHTDIVVPRSGNARRSRGVVVHEYGHFMMCAFLDKFDPKSLTLIALDTMVEGANPVEANDHTRIAMEAFADFVSAQVVGATNYTVPLNNFTASEGMNYCDGTGTLLCLEEDEDRDNTGNNQIARFVTLLHDAYDGVRAANAIPTNGDNFLFQPSVSGVLCPPGPGGQCLTAHATSYGFDPNDDQVALPASSLDDIVFWGLQGTVVDPFSTGDLSRGLGLTMLHHEVSWCDMCDVFARHQPGAPAGTQAEWQFCTQDPISDYIPIGPPEPDLRIDDATCEPCNANETSDPNGNCVPCAGEVTGNACNCTEHQIEVMGACVDCAAHELADQINNVCVPCSVDDVLDINAIDPTLRHCPWQFVDATGGDTCPGVVVADILNLDALVDPGDTGRVAFEWVVPAAFPGDCEGPTYLMFLQDTTGGVFPFNGSRVGSGTLVVDPGTGTASCTEQPHPALAVDADEIAAGLTSVRVVTRTIEPAGATLRPVMQAEIFNHVCGIE